MGAERFAGAEAFRSEGCSVSENYLEWKRRSARTDLLCIQGCLSYLFLETLMLGH